jgi:hypothetical protein
MMFGVRCVEIGVKNHMKQCETVNIDGAGLVEKVAK